MILQTFSTIALPIILPTCAEAIRCKDCGELYYPKQAWLHAACAFGSKGLPVFRDAAGVKRDGLFKYPAHRVTDGVLDGVDNIRSVDKSPVDNAQPVDTVAVVCRQTDKPVDTTVDKRKEYQRTWAANKRRVAHHD